MLGVELGARGFGLKSRSRVSKRMTLGCFLMQFDRIWDTCRGLFRRGGWIVVGRIVSGDRIWATFLRTFEERCVDSSLKDCFRLVESSRGMFVDFSFLKTVVPFCVMRA